MLSSTEPWEETETATNKIATMFLNFGKSEHQRSYKKKSVFTFFDSAAYVSSALCQIFPHRRLLSLTRYPLLSAFIAVLFMVFFAF